MTNPEIDVLTSKAWSDRLLDLKTAYESALDLLEWSESINYKKGVADSAKVLGYCYWRFSDFSLSLSHSLKALHIYEKMGDRMGEADTLNNIGAVYMFQNDNEKRLEVNLKCKAIRQEIGDLEGVSSSEGNIGETYFEMGDLSNAEKRFNSVLNNKNSSPQGNSWALHNLGKVFKVRQKWDKSLEYFKRGLELSESVNYTVLITDSYLAIVELYLDLNQLDDALNSTEKALEVSREIGAKEGEKLALFYLSKIYELKGQFEESLKYHKDYHTLDIEISRDTEIERLKTAQLKVAFDKIEQQKNELIESIRYAERIQNAVLTRDQQQTLLTDFFVFFQPRDIVSGDFYWYHEKSEYFYLGVADCTGHGVPGAFLTMLGTTFMNEIIAGNDNISPADLLEDLRTRIVSALSNSENPGARDGLDISIIRLNTKTLIADWSGAYNPLWIVRKSGTKLETSSPTQVLVEGGVQLIELKADKQPIGLSERMLPFKNHRAQLNNDDVLYLFSDGYADQFGGERGKKYKTKPFKKKLLTLHSKSMEEQGVIIQDFFTQWKGERNQVDDVCVLGFRV